MRRVTPRAHRTGGPSPPWARASVLVVAALAGLGEASGIANLPLEPLYGAAVRSMSESWRNFFFGSLDPYGTVTLDKLPGAFWVQALFVRLLGFHYWVVVVPQVLAVVATVLVLARAVRRLAGPVAGVVAAVVVVAVPALTLAARGNLPDPILVLLLVAAADATSAAIVAGRRRPMVLAALFVGLAFQAKMLEAWFVLPAFALAYLVAAPSPRRRRLADLGLGGGVVLAVSLAWMMAVSAVPARDRPFVDGTHNDSLFSQVFVYNGWGRVGIHLGTSGVLPQGGPFLGRLLATGPLASVTERGPSPGLLFAGPIGRDVGWLLPVALLAGLAVVVERRGMPRTDVRRAAVLLWGGWLAVLAVAFSAGLELHAYYAAALAPAIAALVGVAGPTAVELARDRRGRWALVAVTAGAVAYGAWLVPAGAPLRPWLAGLGAAVVAAAALILLRSASSRPGVPGAVAVGAALLWLPATATGIALAHGLGSFSTPFQSASVTRITTTDVERLQARLPRALALYAHGRGIVLAAFTSELVAAEIMTTGREFLPIGGVSGLAPAPSLGHLERLVTSGKVRLVIVPVLPPLLERRARFVETRCTRAGLERASAGTEVATYFCG